jgi:hypothetical protein
MICKAGAMKSMKWRVVTSRDHMNLPLTLQSNPMGQRFLGNVIKSTYSEVSHFFFYNVLKFVILHQVIFKLTIMSQEWGGF